MSTRIGVIRGGVSSEYPISLKTGAAVLRALTEEGFETVDILLDKEGVLHIKGLPKDFSELHSHVDLVWNALHGHFGEDGKLQQLLDHAHIPYTGSRPLAGAMGLNKQVAKERAKALGLEVPTAVLINPEEETASVSEITGKIYRTMAPPWVVKPLTGGSSIHAYLARTVLELAKHVEDAMSRGELFLVEQYIYGKEVSASVIDGFRGEEHYVAPIMEIPKGAGGLFTHEMKYGENPHGLIGGGLNAEQKKIIAHHAREIHKALGAEDFSQSEFIVSNRGKIYFIEVNTNPGLTETSLLPRSLKHVGSGLRELVSHIVKRRVGK